MRDKSLNKEAYYPKFPIFQVREYEADPESNIKFYNPRNTQAIDLYFRGEKMAKVIGTLAKEKPQEGSNVSGILIKRNFNYHIVSPKQVK